MARGRSVEDLGTLQMALVGFQLEKEKIETRIRELQAQLKGGRSAAEPSREKSPRAKRQLSAAARARIAAAQRKRWADHRKRQAQQARTAKAQTPKTQAAT